MHRTTVTLKDELFKKIEHLAKHENRSAPNLIETILVRYLEENLDYVDPFEMESIRRDKSLKKGIRRGLSDYQAKKGRFI